MLMEELRKMFEQKFGALTAKEQSVKQQQQAVSIQEQTAVQKQEAFARDFCSHR